QSNVEIMFNNTGTVDVQTGTLFVTNGGTSSGAFTGQAAGTLRLGGTHVMTPTSSIAGALSANLQGIIDLTGVYNITGATTVNAGLVTFSGTLTSLGSLTISGGNAV